MAFYLTFTTSLITCIILCSDPYKSDLTVCLKYSVDMFLCLNNVEYIRLKRPKSLPLKSISHTLMQWI